MFAILNIIILYNAKFSSHIFGNYINCRSATHNTWIDSVSLKEASFINIVSLDENKILMKCVYIYVITLH